MTQERRRLILFIGKKYQIKFRQEIYGKITTPFITNQIAS